MAMGKVEDYTKDNLINLKEDTEKLIVLTKNFLNENNHTKYSPLGQITLNFRRELKRLAANIQEDLNDEAMNIALDSMQSQNLQVEKSEDEKLKETAAKDAGHGELNGK